LVARELGATALIEVAVFVAIVLVALIHAARRGLLRWT
jgi:NADH-quinone oxidoreductase subunit A